MIQALPYLVNRGYNFFLRELCRSGATISDQDNWAIFVISDNNQAPSDATLQQIKELAKA